MVLSSWQSTTPSGSSMASFSRRAGCMSSIFLISPNFDIVSSGIESINVSALAGSVISVRQRKSVTCIIPFAGTLPSSIRIKSPDLNTPSSSAWETVISSPVFPIVSSTNSPHSPAQLVSRIRVSSSALRTSISPSMCSRISRSVLLVDTSALISSLRTPGICGLCFVLRSLPTTSQNRSTTLSSTGRGTNSRATEQPSRREASWRD
mmetsp:Transcript_23344/g.34249  ORF Transcript_23344/g.34249 Transcript_23344/m.34249 type:complete len:207 (-) Transcript_23344:2720-3340(-)